MKHRKSFPRIHDAVQNICWIINSTYVHIIAINNDKNWARDQIGFSKKT